ncbi:MAG: uroporphyrinogen-III C-methyltransferase [Sphingomonas sp.]|uniref:uroporphyrinogen-III C-methyltransferase n=1 Tax=Sphingomonas sp. TaxID=28214 RepID=UPI000DB82128|nr:uroporphyrinogen-III C-methyltransferase [Zymomonas sp.]MBA4773195.1 uroporphyrinogen-III C-methyltransferase [Sphingomonas sp.]PZP19966.1 MAG: uroporphyrinogen-III C-methyltransferase [Sphingomonas hengshuiensis]
MSDIDSPSTGRVVLVGAGPGDPDLMTVRGHNALLNADLVVHDGLVDPRILALVPGTSRISVAKARSRHTMRQEAINDLLIAEARRGKLVVRLKGGDPFIFGRGGEEVEACLAAGVPVEVIPGITAAMGAAAGALMPLTHRHIASAITFVAGQCKGLAEQDWTGLAGDGRTLVIYMGLATAEAIADKLIGDGVPPAMPVAVLEKGGRPDARVLRGTLIDLAAMIARKRVESPALIVVGMVAETANTGLTAIETLLEDIA